MTASRPPRYCAHPWHGVDTYHTPDGPHSPLCIVHAYIEMGPNCEVKSELDKDSGHLWVDRPQKMSNFLPCFYGLIPQTYAHKQVTAYTQRALADHPLAQTNDLRADQDPLDICVFSDRRIPGGNFFLNAQVLGGFRMIDSGEVDDKIIAILCDDASYSSVTDLEHLPQKLLQKLEHYFLTYKEIPATRSSAPAPPKVQIISHYGKGEAADIIRLAHQDYRETFLLTPSSPE